MTCQTGIIALGTSDHAYFELNLRGADNRASLATIIEALNLPTTAGVNIVLGVRPELWAELSGHKAKAHDFSTPIVGKDDYTMPATQSDIWIWIASGERSHVYDTAKKLLKEISGVTELVRETVGWVYNANHDLTGFEDGTENPHILSAPMIAADEEGDSILLFQHWEHKAASWDKTPQAEQEKVIGRTKPDSIELEGDAMLETSHVERTTVRIDGTSQEIFRRNVAYGNVLDHGTLFVGFAKDQFRTEEMLRQMAGVTGPRDALTFFTQPTSGSWYICPSLEHLGEFLPED
ncbi:MAG: Dyp-type peroxidase [Corynebacterium sp.]|nr:Dyp-type peroxidase [Corynebacterium sp.]